MVKRDKFVGVVAARSGLLKFAVPLALLLNACVPTLSGHLQSPTLSEDYLSASVVVTRLDSPQINQSYTAAINADGSFRIADLPKGEYLVEAVAPNYKVAGTKVIVDKPQSIVLKLEPLEAGSISLFNVREFEQSSGQEGTATLNPPNL